MYSTRALTYTRILISNNHSSSCTFFNPKTNNAELVQDVLNENKTSIPSIVAYDVKTGAVHVGWNALTALKRIEPQDLVFASKRMIGKEYVFFLYSFMLGAGR